MKFLDPIIPAEADASRVRDGLFDMERRRIQQPTFQIKGGDKTYGVFDFLEVEGGGLAALGTNLNRVAVSPGFDNRLINGCFRLNQRAPATNADDTYAHDRWYALTQTGTIAVSTLTDVEDTTPFMARLTQSQASAQRMGYAQIIEGKNCKHLRGQAVTLSFRSRLSSSANIRYAVLEWTGTEDSVTSDVVLDWTSSTYTANNFFLAASLTISGVSSYAMTANTLATPDKLTVTLGSSFNNLIVFVWTEGTAAQNVTLDIGKVKLEPGSAASRFLYRAIQIERCLCERHYEKSYDIGTAVGTNTTSGSITAISGTTGVHEGTRFKVPKRASPTVTIYSKAGTSAKTSVYTTGADIGTTVTAANISANGFLDVSDSGAGLTAGTMYYFHFTAESEL